MKLDWSKNRYMGPLCPAVRISAISNMLEKTSACLNLPCSFNVTASNFAKTKLRRKLFSLGLIESTSENGHCIKECPNIEASYSIWFHLSQSMEVWMKTHSHMSTRLSAQTFDAEVVQNTFCTTSLEQKKREKNGQTDRKQRASVTRMYFRLCSRKAITCKQTFIHSLVQPKRNFSTIS